MDNFLKEELKLEHRYKINNIYIVLIAMKRYYQFRLIIPFIYIGWFIAN